MKILSKKTHTLKMKLGTNLAAAGIVLGFITTASSLVVAQVQCGDTIGPNETVVLQGNVGPCDQDQDTGGLTVVGPAIIDLNGFEIFCADLDGDGQSLSRLLYKKQQQYYSS